MPYIRPLVKPKVRWQPLTKPVGTVVPPKSPPSNGEVLQLIEKIKEIFESAAQAQGTSSGSASEIISVDVDGNGTLVEMTRAGFEVWKRDRDELRLLKQQGPQVNGETEQK